MKLSIFKKYFPVFLFFYHLLFAYVAWEYVTKNNGDAFRYWFVGQDLSLQSWFSFFQPGTDLIKLITFPLVKYLQLPFWVGFVIFTMFSYLGFYKLWQIVVSLTTDHQTSFFAGVGLLLLPNLHLWTSFIGKESILFVPLVLMADKIRTQDFRSPTFALSFLLVALIRPHVGVVLLLAFLIAFIGKGNLTRKNLIKLSLITVIILAGLYWMIRKIAFIKTNPWERILHVYQYHIKGLKKTSAYVPLDEYCLPYKMFTFYFRPLPFEKTGWLYQVWSFENFVLLLLSLAVLYGVLTNLKKIKWDFSEIFTIFAVLLMGVMYVYAYANYGLIARTKIMAMPFIYIFTVKMLAQTSTIQFKTNTQRET